MQRKIRKAVVIGSGVMGGGIAALLAGAGIKTLLLDIVPPNLADDEKQNREARNSIAKTGLDNIAAARPALLMQAKDLDLITIGNLEDDFDRMQVWTWLPDHWPEWGGVRETSALASERGTHPFCLASSR